MIMKEKQKQNHYCLAGCPDKFLRVIPSYSNYANILETICKTTTAQAAYNSNLMHDCSIPMRSVLLLELQTYVYL